MRRRPGPETGLMMLIGGGAVSGAGLAMIACAAIGLLGDGRELLALSLPGAAAVALGAATMWAGRSGILVRLALRPTIGFAAVTVAWAAAAVVGAVPMLIAGTFSSGIDALFESMSGFTTTGATLISDIDAQADAILAWRSVMQWLGGIGIVVLVVAVAPATGIGVQSAFYAEASGVTDERLTPRIVDTAKIIASVYLVLTLAAGIGYLIAGAGVFDAFNHMLTTVATGGFSTHSASIAFFDSLPVELIAIAFMTAGGVNFAFYWRAIRGGPLMPQLAEVRAYLLILAGAIVAVTLSLLVSGDVADLSRALRSSAFSVTSIFTSTGYTTVDFDSWNHFARILLLLLMVTGACAGSTAGGVKVLRSMLLLRAAGQELDRQIRPRAVQVLRFGGRPYSEDVRRAVTGFMLLYVAIYALATAAFAITGLDFDTSIGATTATLNIVGPGIGDVGAIETYQQMPEAGRILSIALMLVGRLEIFTVVALFAALVQQLRRR